MDWLLEEPARIVFLGVFVEAILLGALIQTGRGWLAIAMGVTFVLIAALLVTERLIVTPTESVERTLNAIARDLESNDPDRVIVHLSTVTPELRETAVKRLKSFQIKQADVKGRPKITVVDEGDRRTAVADVKGLIVGDARDGMVQDFRYLSRFILYFRWENGGWRLYQYEEQDVL